MSGAAEDDGNGGSISEVAEDDGSGGSMRKLSEDDGRWQFDVLQSRFGGRAEVMCITIPTVLQHVLYTTLHYRN